MSARMTLEQFLDRPDTEPASEFVCGEVIQKPMPDRPHASIQAYLMVMLFQFLSQSGLGRVFPEFRCIFGPSGREQAFVPDLVYISRERLTNDRFHHMAPDIAIEVLSPDHRPGKLLERVTFFLLYGVRLVWVIDPDDRTIVVLAPGEEPRTLKTGDVLDGGSVLPGFSVSADDIFAQIEV